MNDILKIATGAALGSVAATYLAKGVSWTVAAIEEKRAETKRAEAQSNRR